MKRSYRRLTPLSTGILSFVNTIPSQIRVFGEITANWTSIVGENTSKHSMPVSLVNKTLLINVDDPIWVNELTMYKSEIINNIQNNVKQKNVRYLIKYIKIKNGKVTPHNEEKQKAKPLPQIDKNKLKLIESRTSIIKDPKLKDALTNYLIAVAGRSRI